MSAAKSKDGKHSGRRRGRPRLPNPPVKHPRPGYVYLIRRPDGIYKIGRSESPDYRREQLDSKHPGVRVVFQLAVADMCRAERALHQMFAHKRLREEWFALSSQEVCQLTQVQFEAPPRGWKISNPRSVRIDIQQYTKAKRLAAKRGVSPREYLAALLRRALKQEWRVFVKETAQAGAAALGVTTDAFAQPPAEPAEPRPRGRPKKTTEPEETPAPKGKGKRKEK